MVSCLERHHPEWHTEWKTLDETSDEIGQQEGYNIVARGEKISRRDVELPHVQTEAWSSPEYPPRTCLEIAAKDQGVHSDLETTVRLATTKPECKFFCRQAKSSIALYTVCILLQEQAQAVTYQS